MVLKTSPPSRIPREQKTLESNKSVRGNGIIRSGRVHDLSWSTASGPSSSVSLRHAVFLSRRHAKEVQGVPDVHEIAEVVEGVSMLPRGLGVC